MMPVGSLLPGMIMVNKPTPHLQEVQTAPTNSQKIHRFQSQWVSSFIYAPYMPVISRIMQVNIPASCASRVSTERRIVPPRRI